MLARVIPLIVLLATGGTAQVTVRNSIMLANGTVFVSFMEPLTNVSAPEVEIAFKDASGTRVTASCQAVFVGNDGLDIGSCKAGGEEVNLPEAAAVTGGRQDVVVHLYGLNDKFNQSVTVSWPLPSFRITVEPNTPGADRSKVVLRADNQPTAAAIEAAANSPAGVKVRLDFDPTESSPPYTARVQSIVRDASNASVFNLVLRDMLPRRAKKYTVNMEIPVTGADALKAKAPVEYSATTPERAKALNYFDVTWDSTVKGEKDCGPPEEKVAGRCNVFKLTFQYNPVITRMSRGLNSSGANWTALRPLLAVDVDTRSGRNKSKAKSTDRMEVGLDYDRGHAFFSTDSAGRLGTAPLEALVWKNGLRVESNRDLKLMYGYWRTQITPWFRRWQQTQLNRIYTTQQAAGNAWTPPVLSAWSFLPSVSHDLGGTLRDHLAVSKYPTDLLARVVVGLELSVEIKRTMTFAASHSYFILYTLDRRRHRNYLELRTEMNTGQLFRFDRGGVQHSIIIKWQRGEQSPRFEPVNSLSVGPKLYF